MMALGKTAASSVSSALKVPGISRLLQHSASFTSNATSVDLRGVYPPIATPFNADESIAWDKLQSNMDRWNKTPIRGYLAQGSNGEYCYLSWEERVEMIKKVRQFAGPDKLVLAGSGCESTSHTIQMTSAMAQAGADVAVVITPCYFNSGMTAEALKRHYTAVADAAPIPVVLYSVPANTGVDLPVGVAAQLARHPNIIGMKESGGDIVKIGQMLHATRDTDFQLLAGSASFLQASLNLGAVGAISALATVLPEAVCRLQRLCEQGDAEAARELQLRLIAPNTAVTKGFGVPGLKAAMGWFGLYGGPVRRPLIDLGEAQVKQVKSAFVDDGFL